MGGGELGEGPGGKEAAAAVATVFKSVSRQVQFLLDHNHLLLNEINHNQEMRQPEGLARNVILIRQLNANIAKVADLYATLSSSFGVAEVLGKLHEVESDKSNSVASKE
ncbi:hypothetical protein M758_2G108100 [Ceratodon purpureus]|nr:hypothetical protein M758_2G108100 [Ceratodon purpureus]